MKKIRLILLLVFTQILNSCGDYLDIVPDNIATIDHAFNMRTTAERFLFTCYSYLPTHGTFAGNIANAAGDELWLPATNGTSSWYIARGYQRVNNPYMNYWQGNNGGRDFYEAIRQCNIFLENINRVPDMEQYEKDRWIAEVKFLKAYYHFYLLRLYGPIPLIKENVPVSADYGDVYPTREPIDACFDYIIKLIDEATVDLPEKIDNEITELGRLTKAIAYCQKAIILTEAASPLFNGNKDFVGYKNNRGEELFNNTESIEKWIKAADACKIAIDFCHEKGHKLYTFNPQFFQYKLTDTIKTQMNIRNAVCEKWNSEIIWANTTSRSGSIQAASTPRGLDPAFVSNSATGGYMAPPIKIAEMYYSDKGIPIDEDQTFDYAGRWGLEIGDENTKQYIRFGYTTSKLHFHREPRFYANLAFDGGVWYGQGKFDDKADLLFVSAKKGQPCAAQNLASYSVTGYWPKKIVNYTNVISANTYTIEQYPWPEIRLGNIYLLYSEALNEAYGPSGEAYKWINLIRERAGLNSVEDSWKAYSKRPDKYTTQNGLREIIHRERLIEMSFEGQRYWDIRRWKEATSEFNKPIIGWDTQQEDAASYYRQKIIFNQQFSTRDYFNPIPESELLSNKNLNQSPGW